MIKTIFVGDKPSPRMKPKAKAFDGAVCHKRLQSWINEICAHPCALFNRVDVELLIHVNVQKRAEDAKVNLPFKFVALGNEASKFLEEQSVPHFKLPHPSGRNRKLNNKKFIEEQLILAKEYLQGVEK